MADVAWFNTLAVGGTMPIVIHPKVYKDIMEPDEQEHKGPINGHQYPVYIAIGHRGWCTEAVLIHGHEAILGWFQETDVCVEEGTSGLPKEFGIYKGTMTLNAHGDSFEFELEQKIEYRDGYHDLGIES